MLLVVVTLFILSTAAVYGWTDWLTLKTDHFTVFYKTGQEAEAKQLLQTLEFYRPRVEKLCGNETFHLSVVIDDTGMMVDGFSDPVYSRIHLFRTAPNGWAGTENWWSLVGVHEYTHELSLTKTSGVPEKLSNIFGKSILFMPNELTPGWIIEGITVYNESQLTRFQGRLNDGLFDAYIGARVRDGRFPSILEATNMPTEYQESPGYTFGGEFFGYLAKTYGEAKLTEFFEVNGGQAGAILFTPAFGLDRSAKQVFGKTFPQLWQDWQQSETERYQNYQYEGTRLTNKGWNLGNLRVAEGKLYYQRSFPVKTGAFSTHYHIEIVERDLHSGAEQVLVATTSDFVANLRVRDGKLYYATYEAKTGCANASELSYGLYAILHEFDLTSRKNRLVLKDEFRSFEVAVDGSVLYSRDLKNGFGSELYSFNPATGNKRLLLQSGYLINEIASDGKRLVVSARRDWEGDSLYLVNPDKQEFIPLVHTAYGERGIELQGNRLFFTANYQKMNSVYCYDFTTNQVSRLTGSAWIGNASYDNVGNQLYFTQLSSYGMDLYQKNAEFQEYVLPQDPVTVRPVFTLSDAEITRGSYRDNLKTLAPKFWFPLIDSDKHEYGFTVNGGDAVMDFPNYSATITYNTKEKEYVGQLMLPVNFFAPLQTALSWEKDLDEEVTQLMLAYPLITRLSPGLSHLNVGTAVNWEEDYQGAEIAPFLECGFQYPQTRLNFAVSAPQSNLKNDKERSGLYGEAELIKYLANSEIRLAASYIDDPDNPDEDLFREIRGYEDGLTAKAGQLFTFEYSRPLFKIRNGFWNPSLYFEDVIGTVFYDQAVPEEGKRQSSWGLELHLETKAVYGFIPIDWGGRFVHNDSGENTYEVFVKTIAF